MRITFIRATRLRANSAFGIARLGSDGEQGAWMSAKTRPDRWSSACKQWKEERFRQQSTELSSQKQELRCARRERGNRSAKLAEGRLTDGGPKVVVVVGVPYRSDAKPVTNVSNTSQYRWTSSSFSRNTARDCK